MTVVQWVALGLAVAVPFVAGVDAVGLARWIIGVWHRWRARRRTEWRQARKAQIVLELDRVGRLTATVGYAQQEHLAQIVGLSMSECLPLLQELEAEDKIRRGILPGTYTTSRWQPDPRRMYG